MREKKVVKIKKPKEARLLLKARKLNLKAQKLPYTLYGMLWYINPFDNDDFPSIPHGDSVGNQYKLDVYTGDVFKKHTREYDGHLSKRDFQRLQTDSSVRRTIELAKKYNQDHHPYRHADITVLKNMAVVFSSSGIERV